MKNQLDGQALSVVTRLMFRQGPLIATGAVFARSSLLAKGRSSLIYDRSANVLKIYFQFLIKLHRLAVGEC